MASEPQKTTFNITPYEPTGPSVDLSTWLHGFWLVPDPSAPNGHRSIPIPHETFMAFLDTLDD